MHERKINLHDNSYYYAIEKGATNPIFEKGATNPGGSVGIGQCNLTLARLLGDRDN